MNCKTCGGLDTNLKFGGYLHFKSTKQIIDNFVGKDFFEIVDKNQYETIFICKDCKSVWRLAEPDFPVTGYLLKE